MANLKDLIVNGSARILGTIYGNLSGTATKATQDGSGNTITSTYAKVSNLVTSISSSSTDTQFPSAKCVYDAINSSGSNIFIATYGTTTYADVLAAYNANKTIVCIWEYYTGQYIVTSNYTYTNSSLFTFYFTEYSTLRAPYLSSSGWGYNDISDKLMFQQVGDWAMGVPDTTSTATFNKPSVIVENYLLGTSGYICFSDTLCIQWGEHGNSKNAVSLLVPMADTNYALLSTRTASGSGVNYTKATTTITPGQAWAATWMIIGYHA